MFCFPHDSPSEPVKDVSRSSHGYNYRILTFAQSAEPPGSDVDTYTVLTDESKTKIFAYMPPRQTISAAGFDAEFEDGDCVEIQDAIEGTMITLFWNGDTDEWDMCTRNGVGGDYAFLKPVYSLFNRDTALFTPKTFRQMVLEYLTTRRFIDDSSKPVRDAPQPVTDLRLDLPKNYCYGFVLRHVDNHLVGYASPLFPGFVPVRIYEISSPLTVKTVSPEDAQGSEIWRTVIDKVGSAHFPTNNILVNKKDELCEWKNARFSAADEPIAREDVRPGARCFPPAWILTNKRTGRTTELKNPIYEKALQFRNIQPNIYYQWLDLRRRKAVDAYLDVFPGYNKLFHTFEQEYEQFVDEVYHVYVKFYILKERDTILPKRYFVQAARIHHNIYLTTRSPVTLATVRQYFATFSTGKLFNALTDKGRDTQEHAVAATDPPLAEST